MSKLGHNRFSRSHWLRVSGTESASSFHILFFWSCLHSYLWLVTLWAFQFSLLQDPIGARVQSESVAQNRRHLPFPWTQLPTDLPRFSTCTTIMTWTRIRMIRKGRMKKRRTTKSESTRPKVTFAFCFGTMLQAVDVFFTMLDGGPKKNNYNY